MDRKAPKLDMHEVGITKLSKQYLLNTMRALVECKAAVAAILEKMNEREASVNHML